MILTLIFGVITLAAIVFLVLGFRTDDDFFGLAGICGILGGIPFIVTIAAIIGAQNSYTQEQVRMKYSQTVTQLNSTREYIDNITDDYARSVAVLEYNSEVGNFKQDIMHMQINLKNPWINWFSSYVYNEFDANVVSYIE